MEDTMPEPLIVKKRSCRRFSSVSTSSYPSIPRRQSSLSASASYDSNGPATSTRTPSLSDSLYQIDVTKVRKTGAGLQNGFKSGHDALEDPFMDQGLQSKIAACEKRKALGKFRAIPQVLVRWSSGSWDSVDPCLSSRSSTKGFLNTKSPTLVVQDSRPPSLVQSLSDTQQQPGSQYLSPMDLPISFANLRAAPNNPSIGMNPLSIWTTVEVLTDISSISLPDSSTLAPLDLVILLDRLQHPSVSRLTQIALGVSAIASSLVYNHDRIALACVDGSSKSGFEILLPLGFHHFETSQSALNIFASRHVSNKRRGSPDLEFAISQISQLFCRSPRPAFCHLVFLSSTPQGHFSMPEIDGIIGFHTITPQTCFPLGKTSHPPGWHIFYEITSDDAPPRDIYLSQKVSKAIRQLRTGINPGAISDLKLSVIPGHGCQVQSVLGDCQLTHLRPGESWVVPVQIGIPAADLQRSRLAGCQKTDQDHHPIIRALLNQVNTLLDEYSSMEIGQHVLTARLEYKHSFLPEPSAVHLEADCTIFRHADRTLGASWNVGKTLTTKADEEDDCSSISLGSSIETPSSLS